MSVKTIMVLSSRLISIDNTDPICTINFETGDVTVTSDGTARTAKGWFDYIDTATASTSDLTSAEFTSIIFASIVDGFTVKDEGLADATGFVYNQLYEPGNNDDFYGTFWGTSRLILQGSESTDSKGVTWISRMLAPERVTGKVNNETWESVDYVVNSYDKRFDMKRWKIPCHWLGTEKEQWVRDFLDAASSSRDSDEVTVYGDEHWIAETETWKLMNDQYGGITTDLGHALLVKFMIGLRLVVT